MERLPDWLQKFDERLFLAVNHFLNRRESEAVENLLRFANALGTWPAALLLLVIVALVGQGSRFRRFFEVGLAGAFSFAASHVLKDWVSRARPKIALADAFVDGRAWTAFEESLHQRSFPSGHTTTAFTLAVLLAVWAQGLDSPWRRTAAAAAAFTLAALTGVARIYAGAHFPLDVAAGAALGAACAGLSLWVVRLLAGPRAAPGPVLDPPPAPAPAPRL